MVLFIIKYFRTEYLEVIGEKNGCMITKKIIDRNTPIFFRFNLAKPYQCLIHHLFHLRAIALIVVRQQYVVQIDHNSKCNRIFFIENGDFELNATGYSVIIFLFIRGIPDDVTTRSRKFCERIIH